MIQGITSLQNPLIKKVQRLQEKSRERRQQGLFVAEGRREVSLALSCGYHAQAIFICQEIFDQDVSYPVDIEKIPQRNIYQLSTQVYNKIAYRNDLEGIIMLGKIPDHSLQQLKTGKNPLVVILEKVEKPGNLGAILRSCDAAGTDAIIICEPATDIYNPNTIRASLGCIFSNQIATASVEEVVQWLKNSRIISFAASPEAKEEYDIQDYTKPTALVFGSESQGLSEHLMNALEKKIRIPMMGSIDSLNVSVSAAIMLFEAVRQRRRKNL
jgi:RNA methyltransferase, TrmH family